MAQYDASDNASAEQSLSPQASRLREALLELVHGLPEKGSRRLPSERQMMLAFSTTRITLREALGQLENAGRIYRESRRGWFAAAPRLRYELLAGLPFHEMVESQQRQAMTHLLSAETVAASRGISQRLGLPESAPVYRIVRARAIDGRRVLYVEHHLRPDCFPGILSFDLEGMSLTALYRQEYAIRISRVDYELGSTVFGGPAGEALYAAPGTPAQRITRVNRDQNGRIVDCDDEYWRHDAIELTLSAVPRPG
ncbi:UTRA domain-containing protein [Salinicola corii]|uniref:UTRA domain-containing protein n=1 Tax=Salinicola corii TaxID=2606937 RepID=A0A640WJZ3_9GAMM|nr:UTRA domain-containing protein [Salinicola corii]KAA0020963.1 UTRA domain-containing protein [Salinicola corii]